MLYAIFRLDTISDPLNILHTCTQSRLIMSLPTRTIHGYKIWATNEPFAKKINIIVHMYVYHYIEKILPNVLISHSS